MLAPLAPSVLLAMCLTVAMPPGTDVVDEAAIASLAPDQQLLVREYARQWPKVFQFYTSMTFEGAIYDESRTDANAHFTLLSEFRGTAKILNNQMFRLTGSLPDGSSGMVIATPTDVYGFEWNDTKNKYFLASRFATQSKFMDQFISKYAFHIEPFSNGEFQRIVFGIPQSANQTVTLESIEALQEEGEEIVKATVVCRGQNKGSKWSRILLFTFLRNQSWAKRDFISAFPDESTRTYSIASTRCFYEGSKDGIPLLKECTRESGVATFSDAAINHCHVFAPGEVAYYTRSRAVADVVIPGPPDISEFDPRPYLENIGGLGKSRYSYWQPVFLCSNGTFLLIIGVLLLRRARQYWAGTHCAAKPGNSSYSEVHGTCRDRKASDV